MGKKRLRAAKLAAKRLPAWAQDVAFSKANKGRKGYERRRLGKLGPASEVRHIDPAEYPGDKTLSRYVTAASSAMEMFMARVGDTP